MKSFDYMKYLKILFTIGIIIFIAYYLYNNQGDLKVFLTISWKFIVIVTIGLILIQLANSIFLKVILKVFDKDMPASDSAQVTFLSSLTNILTPFRGGAGVRAVYLKENFSLDYKSFVTVLLGNYIIIFLVSTFFGLIALSSFINDKDISVSQLYVTIGFFFAIFIGMIFLVLFDLEKILRIIPERWKIFRSVKSLLRKINQGWQKIVKRKDILLALVLLTIVNYLLIMFVFYMELRSIGVYVEIKNLMVYSSLSSISLLLSFTPGSLGIKEAILLFSQDLLGLEASQIIAISVFDRTLSILVIVFSFLSIWGVRKLLKYRSKEEATKND